MSVESVGSVTGPSRMNNLNNSARSPIRRRTVSPRRTASIYTHIFFEYPMTAHVILLPACPVVKLSS